MRNQAPSGGTGGGVCRDGGGWVRSHLGTLALKTEDCSKKSVVLVKRKNGFTKTISWTETPGKTRRRAF